MVTIIFFFSDFQVKWEDHLPRIDLLGPSNSWEKLPLSFSFLWNLLTNSCHFRNSQDGNALEDNAVLQNKIVMPLPVWWFHLWNVNAWEVTDGVRAMLPIISSGYCYGSVLHILSEAGGGMDLLCLDICTHRFLKTQPISVLVSLWKLLEQKISWSTSKCSRCSQNSSLYFLYK